MKSTPLFWLKNKHINTIYTSQFRKVNVQDFQRKRLTTSDNDFIDVDWVKNRSNKSLVILSHGLEGSSRRAYIQGMINSLTPLGFDCLAWNYRGCSGEPNLKPRSYHSGETEDLELVIQHGQSQKNYQNIVLIGFSLGGNITLKYLGDKGNSLNPVIKKAIAVSTPIHLKDSSIMLNIGFSKIYTNNFLKTLKQKALDKKHLLSQYDLKKLDHIKTLKDFDNLLTAPIHGFKNADEYYAKASSKKKLVNIKIPTLIINSSDDPFLGPNADKINVNSNIFNFIFLPSRALS